nr:uncharacterized protein LOC113822207 [Penaeus vannamei]
MKILVIATILSSVSLCTSAEYGSPNVYEFLAPARLNYGFNAGIRLPQLPTLSFKEQEIPIPVPDLANVEIPFVYPIFSIPSRALQSTRLIRNWNDAIQVRFQCLQTAPYSLVESLYLCDGLTALPLLISKNNRELVAESKCP